MEGAEQDLYAIIKNVKKCYRSFLHLKISVLASLQGNRLSHNMLVWA